MLTLELAMRVSEVIQFPPKDQVCMRSNEMKQPMPGALFAMDGTLCRLPHRGKYNEFVSRKSQPQINVLVVCDWNKNLVYVEPGFTGRSQDNDMFNNSVLHEKMKLPDFPLKEGGYILVDEGFACNGRVIRPYSKKRDELDIQFFNKVFKSTRLIVENAIGAWKEKCPLLNIGMHDQDPEDLTVTILASAVLYQFCRVPVQPSRKGGRRFAVSLLLLDAVCYDEQLLLRGTHPQRAPCREKDENVLSLYLAIYRPYI